MEDIIARLADDKDNLEAHKSAVDIGKEELQARVKELEQVSIEPLANGASKLFLITDS